ncbi:MAG: hypothetical protein CSA95_08605 [Bacteroidetes bacterium]|nr:MAG: hypothetical protein CSA95_08605 [Bacteroidota bacterium]
MVHLRRKLAVLLTLLLVMASAISYGQKITVTGKVVSAADGETLIGATVQNANDLTKGTVTDLDGFFTLEVAPGTILKVSYVGFLSREVTVEDQTALTVALEPNSELLNEVVIIGYGVQKKTDKTGAVSHVTAEELNGGNLTDPIQGMQGKAAGVSIAKKGGDPNAGFSVRIRGASGYTASSDPLYVIDGIPGADPTTIAPEDIENFNILKDAASTAIYGSRGANGVIIINTKKGKNDGDEAISEVFFSSKYSVGKIAKRVNLLSADQIRDYANQYGITFNDGGANTDWQDEIYRMGSTLENSLAFSGGTKNSFYRASVSNTDWTGVMKGTDKARTTAKMNITHKGIDDRLTLNGNIAIAFEKNDYESYDGNDKDDIIFQALTRNPTDPVFDSNGEYDHTQRVFNYENPVAVIDMITNIRDAKRYLGSMKADFKFFEGFTGTTLVSYIRNDEEFTYFRPKGVYASADNGWGSRSYRNHTERQMETYFTYVRSINDKHNLNMLGGYSYREAIFNGFNAQAQNPQSPFIGANNLATFTEVHYGDVGSYKNSEKLIGFFGRIQYNYLSKYYLSTSLRRDGSSKFGKNNKWGWFPTVSTSWNIHSEDFMAGVEWLDQLKLRASYGVSGNQAFASGYSQVTYVPTGLATNPENGEQVVTFTPSHNKNDDLRWERTGEANIGIDFALFNSKINGSLELYHKNTTDLLYPRPTALGGGNVARTTFDNAGNIVNQGVELYLQAYVVNKPNFTYKTSLTATHNRSEWKELISGGGEDAGAKNGWLSGRGVVGDAFYIVNNKVGHEVSAFYLPEIVTIDETTGRFIFRSVSGGYTDQLANAKREFVGSPNPIVELGWSNSITFMKNWDLNIAFRSMIGHKKYNATKMFMDATLDLPELNAVEEALEWKAQGRSSSAVIASQYLENATFLKLDVISLGYNFNVRGIDWIKNLKAYVVANNVFTLTGYSGQDPEIYYANLAYGWDQYNVYPNARTISLGINATF